MSKFPKNLEWYELEVFVPVHEIRFTPKGKEIAIKKLTNSMRELKGAFMYNGSKELDPRFKELQKALKQLREDYIDWANSVSED